MTQLIHPGKMIGNKTLESIQGAKVTIPHPHQLTHLQFRRFAGCPMCNLHIQSFIRQQQALAENGIQEVAIFHSSKQSMLKHHAEAPFALIADPLRMLYREFGVEQSILAILHPKAMLPMLQGLFKHGIDMPAGDESMTGLPADFLIDTTGRVVAAKYGEHGYDHWSVEEVLALARDARQARKTPSFSGSSLPA